MTVVECVGFERRSCFGNEPSAELAAGFVQINIMTAVCRAKGETHARHSAAYYGYVLSCPGLGAEIYKKSAQRVYVGDNVINLARLCFAAPFRVGKQCSLEYDHVAHSLTQGSLRNIRITQLAAGGYRNADARFGIP